LEEDAIDAIVGVEAIDLGGDYLGAGVGVEMLTKRSDPDPFARSLFVAHINRTGGIITDAQHRQTGRTATICRPGGDAIGKL
jgi:hypothetical protein